MTKTPQEVYERLLKRERTARKEAEKLLEGKSLELWEANRELQELAESLDLRVQERTNELEAERNRALASAIALRASEKRFNDIAEIVGEYFWEMDPEFKFLSVTAQAAIVFGYTREELVGKSIFDFMDDSEADRLRGILQDHFDSGRPFRNVQLKSRHKDEHSIWQRIGGAPLYDDGGILLRYRGAGLDITEEAKSKSTLEILGVALEHATEGFAITDANGFFTYLNPAHVSIYNYKDASELLGKPWTVLYKPEEAKRLQAEIGDNLKISGSFSAEAEGLRKDGSLFPEVFSLKVLPDGGLLCVCRDITDEKEQQAVLVQAQADAEQGAMAKSVFLANMSHEIRTPLNGIIGMNRILMREPLTEAQQDYANSVDSSAVFLLHIIDDILDFSKIEAGRLEVDSVDFFLPDVVDEVVKILQVRASTKKIDFHLICELNVARWVRGDPSRLRQILLNLAGNAIKFTEEGYVSIRVEAVHSQTEAPALKFIVEDTGIGMEPVIMDRIFSPFDQGDSSISRRFGGTGLGLPITRNLVELIGTIDVSSTPGKGSRFEVSLPLPPVKTPPKEYPPAFAGLPIKALLSGGSALEQEALASLLAFEGLSVERTDDIDEGRELAKSYAVDETLLWMLLPSPRGLPQEHSPFSDGSDTDLRVRPIRMTAEGSGLRNHPFSDLPLIKLPVSRQKLIRQILAAADIAHGDHRSHEESDPQSNSTLLKGMRILLVEDNHINQEVGRITLENLGASVHVADDGYTALSQTEQTTFDLILMDIRMPGIDGMETCMRMRANGLTTKIVALTADAMKGDRERILSAGMNGYLSKPVLEETLVQQIINLFPDQFKSLKSSPDSITETSIEILAFDTLAKAIGGNAAIAWSLLNDFVKQTGELLDLTEQHLQEGDLAKASSVFHRLSGSAFSVQAKELGTIAQKFELACNEDRIRSLPKVPEPMKHIRSAFERLVSHIETKTSEQP